MSVARGTGKTGMEGATSLPSLHSIALHSPLLLFHLLFWQNQHARSVHCYDGRYAYPHMVVSLSGATMNHLSMHTTYIWIKVDMSTPSMSLSRALQDLSAQRPSNIPSSVTMLQEEGSIV
jgi:hypothetical protein